MIDEIVARTWNGAPSYATTGLGELSKCLDYFFKAGTYVNRSQEDVHNDMASIFADNEQVALSIVFGLRLITRKPNVNQIQETQTGYGRRDEFYKAVIWLAHNKPELLYKNLHLIPVFGCWKDLLQPPLINLLDQHKVYELVANNLGDDLLRKYLPQIRSNKKIRSDRDRLRSTWAKGLCNFLGMSYANYRKLKSHGNAHIWQKQMTENQWDKINFNGIPGKAMFLHTTQTNRKDKLTVFERHLQIERLRDWLENQTNVKFTGYPYELTKAAQTAKSIVQKITLDKQFQTAIEPMQGHKLGNVLACLDISGSMTSDVVPGVSAYDICMSMGLAFSMLNTGWFKDTVCGFSNQCIIKKLEGTMTERLKQIEEDRKFQDISWGSTNFQGVIDLICEVRRKNPSIPLEEYPETLLVISDMQFNDTGDEDTNYQKAVKKLQSVGLGDVRIIWWCVNGQTTDFPAQMDSKGCYMIGGFDPNNLKSLMGLSSAEKTAVKGTAEKQEKPEVTPVNGLKNFISQPIFGLLQI